jgi:hypothetical protein
MSIWKISGVIQGLLLVGTQTRHNQKINTFLEYVKGCRQDDIASRLAPLINITTHELTYGRTKESLLFE